MSKALPHPYLPAAVVFLLFIFGFTIYNLLTPSTEVSVLERRALAQRPPLEASSVFSGQYMADYASFMQDQAALRDPLRFLKSAVERNVFWKLENNGVYVVGDRVYDKFYGIRTSLATSAAGRMNEIIVQIDELQAASSRAAADVPGVFLAVIPTKAQGLQRNSRYLLSDQHEIADALRDTVDAAYLDLMDLAEKQSETAYYGADPHWNTAGVIEAYDMIARGLGLESVDDYEFEVLSEEYIGSEYGKAAAWRVPLDTIELAHNDILDGMTIRREETAERVVDHDSIYVPPTPETVDLYDVFLGGLAPIIVINNDSAPSDQKLVIFKDSYAHAIAPFLAQHYRTVTLVDLRYVQRQYVLDHVDFSDATTLFLYSTSVINTDPRALN